MGSAARMATQNQGFDNSVTTARVIRIVFGVLAGAMLIAAVGDILVFGHLTIVTPFNFGALLAIALAFLINNFWRRANITVF